MNNYYNTNAKDFFEGTVKADMSPYYAAFLEKLPEGAHILDAGCGSGRDSLYFKKLGYKITAMEPATELCKLASEHVGQEVLALSFQEVAFEETGVLYATFKHGEFEGERSGRYFYDLTEQKADQIFKVSGFEVEKMWITGDVRPECVDENWLNIMLIKV